MADDEDLQDIDRALLRLRRIWEAPSGVEHQGRRVDGSTLLVCLVVEEAASAADAPESGVVEVAAALDVAHSTASRLVSRAVAAGMLRRSASTQDPRRVALSLTPAGRDLVAASRAFRVRRLSRTLADWPAGDVRALADLLSRFAERVHRL